MVMTVCLTLVCRSTWAYTQQSFTGEPWDETVSDENRPLGIYENSSGNYVIKLSTSQHLAWYAWKTRTEGNATELAKYTHADIVLTDNIDMIGHSWRGIGEKDGGSRGFRGTFDGQGHTISNLCCERYNGDHGAGLFDYIQGSCEIKNLTFSKCGSYCEDRAGIVAGGLDRLSNVKFTNLTFDDCYIEVSDENAGFVVGGILASTNIEFNGITVKNCYFGYNKGQKYGGLIGAIAWGDCSVSVKNCFISVRNFSGKPNFRTGGIAGWLDHGSNLDVDNCVIDMYKEFFTNCNDQGAIVSNWEDSSKPKARHVLVVANPRLPYNNMNIGLFAGYTESSSSMELSDCFINKGQSSSLKEYDVVSKQIVDRSRCVASNIKNIDLATVSAEEAKAVVMMNEAGACFGLNPLYNDPNKRDSKNLKDFVIPLSDASKGKLVGFTGKDYVSSVSGGICSNYTMPSGSIVVMAQGQTMNYMVKSANYANQWVIADSTTNMSSQKRIGKWEFSGVPTGAGKLYFSIAERPKIYAVDSECKYNSTSQRVTLKWQVENKSVFNISWKDHGQWYIYRDSTLVDSLASDKDTWTDFAPLAGKNTYNVYFVSKEYMYDNEDNVKYLSKTYTSQYNVNLNASNPLVKNGKVVNTVGVPNASALNGSRVRLLKWDTERDIACGGNLDSILTKADALTVYEAQFLYNQLKTDDFLDVTYEDDMGSSSLCTTYYYMWVVDNINDSNFKKAPYHTGKLTLTNDTEIKFKSFTATKGKSTSKVTLKWSAENYNNESLRYVIERKIYSEQDDENWTSVYETTSSLNTGSFDDEVLPGYVYRYRIRLYPFCESAGGNVDYKSEAGAIGFAASRGTIQGRITYNSGLMNVEGVDVRLKSEEDELARSMTSYAMQFMNEKQTMPLASGVGSDFWNGEWTLQFLLRNDSEKSGRLISVPGGAYVTVVDDKTICLGDNSAFSINVNYGTYEGNYILLQHGSNGYRLGKTAYDDDKQEAYTIWTEYYNDYSNENYNEGDDTMWFGTRSGKESFIGAVDEVRLWQGSLSDKSISDTYNRYLSGNENGLMAYYTFDSGVGEYAFDSSHPSGNWNNRDMELPENKPMITSIIIPESSVLAYRGITDKNGEYTISGVPFEGEGTNWQIVPSYGAHDFSPTSTRRLVSTNTLVHTGIDFTDISSFKVKGKVYYESTNYPVEGCNVLIDGSAVMEGSNEYKTNLDGEFEVDVAIGTHTLSLSLDSHTFTDSLTMYFNKDVHDLWFYDNTRVTVAGRICGGEVEYAKPLGLAASKNNIGKALITLKPSNQNYYLTAENDKNNLIVNPSKKPITYESALAYNPQNTAHTGQANDDGSMGTANRIYITTDSLTGEFAVKLPPIRYEVEDIYIASAPDSINKKLRASLSYLDARNTSEEYTDSVWNGQVTSEGLQVFDYFTYQSEFKSMIQNPAEFLVWQDEDDKYFFGEDSVEYYNKEGKSLEYSVYDKTNHTYRLSGIDGGTTRPIFNQFQSYVFNMKAFQRYVNYDNKAEILEDIMPLPNKTVTISNEMAYENTWLVDHDGKTSFDEIPDMESQLDSLGNGVYRFKVGVPNTTAPFEESMTMMLDNGIAKFTLTGIVLGAVQNGNSFITEGPDCVSMILRDPPGSNSFATWKAGSSVTTGYSRSKSSDKGDGVNSTVRVGYAPLCGTEKDFWKGSYGFMAEESQKHITMDGDCDVNGGWTTTITTTQDISTSSAPEFDGPDADLFIGTSMNSVTGEGLQVHLADDAGVKKIKLRNVQTEGFRFNTSFAYTRYQIKTTVIPNILAKRRALIENPENVNRKDSLIHFIPAVDFSTWEQYTDAEKDALLDKGFNNGYKAIAVKEGDYVDSVLVFTDWANDWKNRLRNNEAAKVEAFSGNNLIANYTFDAGSAQSFSTTVSNSNVDKDHTETSTTKDEVHFGGHIYGGPFGDALIQWCRDDYSTTTTRNYQTSSNQEVFGFTLKENGVHDIITVDRLKAPDGFSDIFHTRAGQTSGYWEPQHVTEYYQSGTEIMAPTQKVFKPRLELVNPEQAIMSIRRGTTATVQFRLINDSETETSGAYKFSFLTNENPNGAVVMINGQPLSTGAVIWINYGTPVIATVNISEPENPVGDEYELDFYLVDNTQAGVVGPINWYPSTSTVKLKFMKSSSEINLSADKLVINSDMMSRNDGKVELTLSGYDTKMENLKYIELQQWNGTKYISLGDSARWVKEKDKEMPSTVTFTIDMSDVNTYPDGEYMFRARTVSDYGSGEVEAFSPEEITIIKDTSAPQPIGNLMPTRGVLTNDNEIAVEFNEDIDGDIRKHTNVELYGELLENASARGVSVYFNGENDQVSTDVPITPLQIGSARSFNLWLKWMGGEGTILSLGTSSNSNRFGVDEEGHLVIYSNYNTIVSKNVFEKGKWAFLSLVADATNTSMPTSITASYILEDGKNVVWLFGDKDGGEHLNGATTPAASFILGNGFHGYMQDLSMWDGVRDMETSNNEKSLKKTRYTPNLMAYWPLNEGSGKTAKDAVSEQNMYLSSETMWSIDNKNYAMRLDKGQKAQLVFSNVNTNYDQDYLLQLWFNADENINNTGSAEVDTLLSYPNGNTSFVIPRNSGKLVLVCKKDSVVLSDQRIADGHWHQLSLMVKKSENGNAVVYLDGDNVGQISAGKVDMMQGVLFLGDTKDFSGYFDEIRIWNGLQNSQAISENLTNRYSTTDCPIAAYFPFEVSGMNQAVDFTLSNYGNMKADGDTVRLVVTDPNVPLGQLVITQETEVVPPLKNAPTLVTRDFSIVSSERKIRLNLSEKEVQEIQGTTVTALVRGLRDKAGNTIQDIRWSFLVEMNDIDWNGLYTVDYDKELYGGNIGFVDIINNTGIEQNWRIEGAPDWMELSHYSGILKAREEFTIDIWAKDNIPIGTNSGMLTLIDDKGICHKLYYSINNIPNSPNWEVGSQYSQVMTVTGQVRVDNVIQENSYSKLAAFNQSGECVGVASPQYLREKNSYYYTMMVYGDESYIGKELSFKFYDAQTGTYYASVEPDELIVFGGDYAKYGSIEDPVYWDTTGKIEQIIDINDGWNWISFNVQESDSISNVFKNDQALIYEEVKDKNNFARYYNGKWEFDEDFGTVTHGRMYKVKATIPAKISRIGKPANLLGTRIRIVPMTNGNPGWSWIGANVTTNMALTTAFGGLTSAPKVGDIIKNFTQYAEYTSSGWMGELNTIIPGKGYMYMSNDDTEKYLIYPNSLAYTPKSSAVRLAANQNDDDLYAEYAGTATVIAAVESDGERMGGCRIYATDSEGNVHGCKVVSDRNGYHLAYLVVHGNEPQNIQFKVVFGEDDDAQTFESTTTLDYFDGLSLGTSDEPFIISISGASAIRGINADNEVDTLYDLSGRPVSKKSIINRGVYIKKNKKHLIK